MTCVCSACPGMSGAGRQESRAAASPPFGSSRNGSPPVDFPAAQQLQTITAQHSLHEIARQVDFRCRTAPPARRGSRWLSQAWSSRGLRARAGPARGSHGTARRLRPERATEQPDQLRRVSSLVLRGTGRACKVRESGADVGGAGNCQCGRVSFRGRGLDDSLLRRRAQPLLQRVHDQRRWAPFGEDAHHRDLAGRQSGHVGQCFERVCRKRANQGSKVRPECVDGRRLLEQDDDFGPARWAERGEQQCFLRTEPVQQRWCADADCRRDLFQGDGSAMRQDRGARCPKNLFIAHSLWPTHGVETSSASRVEVCKSPKVDSVAAAAP